MSDSTSVELDGTRCLSQLKVNCHYMPDPTECHCHQMFDSLRWHEMSDSSVVLDVSFTEMSTATSRLLRIECQLPLDA